MDYYYSTPDLDAQIAEIKKKIFSSMNGVIAENMQQNGIIYKHNFGLNLPIIKQIASEYTPNHDLAQRLWNLQIRETMLLATLLEPTETCTRATTESWVHKVDQLELAEQTVMNLFSKLNFAAELAIDWIHSSERWTQICGYLLAARVGSRFSDKQVEWITDRAIAQSGIDEFHLYKAIALCLSRFCRRGKSTAQKLLDKTTFTTDISRSQEIIADTVKQEIIFLDIL